MSLEIIEKIRESDSLDLALDNALNKLKRAVKKRNDDLHLLNVVTVDDQNKPNTRNVVLRDFSIDFISHCIAVKLLKPIRLLSSS